MKKIYLLMIFLSFALISNAQHDNKIYDEEADAKADFKKALELATAQNKHVLIQVGGNWCHWCLRFNNYVTVNQEIDSIINAHYVVLHINYSTANKNKEIMAELEYPQRFGFPVFLVTDATGKRLHTQNSGFLEKESSYDTAKVKQFLQQWTVTAISKENNQMIKG